jgi:putative protease
MLNDLHADAIIVADGGVVDAVRENAPDCEIHISTQANTVSYHTCKFWHRNGAKRIILGRELNKEQIREICKNKPDDLDIEMFIHGAICFAYSGRCFLSQFLADRSGNLGDCAQSCRWAYNVYVEETNNPGNLMPVETDEKGTYIFSSKDLCLINEIPEIMNLGVNSLKIEGRLKTEYYVATVVNAYRNDIDDYEKDPEHFNSEKYLKELEKTKTRGLTTFYFNDRNNKDIQEYEGKQYNTDYEFGGKVVEYNEEKSIIEIRNKLSVGDELELLIPGKLEPLKFTIEKLWDIETDEEIQTVNPGKLGQQVKMKLPIEAEENWIIRRKKFSFSDGD